MLVVVVPLLIVLLLLMLVVVLWQLVDPWQWFPWYPLSPLSPMVLKARIFLYFWADYTPFLGCTSRTPFGVSKLAS